MHAVGVQVQEGSRQSEGFFEGQPPGLGMQDAAETYRPLNVPLLRVAWSLFERPRIFLFPKVVPRGVSSLGSLYRFRVFWQHDHKHQLLVRN